ncbi:MAG: alpha/beta hydrolase-fold protein [Bacteroidota bacterium]
MRKIFLVIVSLTVFCIGVIAQPGAVTIPGTEVRTITSSIVQGQEYQLYISLPPGYKDPGKKFPVLYVLDGQWDFTLAYSIFGEQYFDGFIPGIIVVGITWGGKTPNPDSLRARDFTPTNISRSPQSGGASKFLSFIKNELIPFIDSKYNSAKDERILMGSSLGGLFTLYTLFNETKLFNRYVLTSPASGWDNGVLYRYEKDYFSKNKQLAAKLFMAIGGLEPNVSDFNKLAAHLQSRNYEGFQMDTRILENTGHSGSKAEGYTKGMQYVFAKPSITIDPGVLKKYAGTYSSATGNKIEIIFTTDHLSLNFSNGSQHALQAESETIFYTKGEFLFVEFKKDEGLLLKQFSGEQFLTRTR